MGWPASTPQSYENTPSPSRRYSAAASSPTTASMTTPFASTTPAPQHLHTYHRRTPAPGRPGGGGISGGGGRGRERSPSKLSYRPNAVAEPTSLASSLATASRQSAFRSPLTSRSPSPSLSLSASPSPPLRRGIGNDRLTLMLSQEHTFHSSTPTAESRANNMKRHRDLKRSLLALPSNFEGPLRAEPTQTDVAKAKMYVSGVCSATLWPCLIWLIFVFFFALGLVIAFFLTSNLYSLEDDGIIFPIPPTPSSPTHSSPTSTAFVTVNVSDPEKPQVSLAFSAKVFAMVPSWIPVPMLHSNMVVFLVPVLESTSSASITIGNPPLSILPVRPGLVGARPNETEKLVNLTPYLTVAKDPLGRRQSLARGRSELDRLEVAMVLPPRSMTATLETEETEDVWNAAQKISQQCVRYDSVRIGAMFTNESPCEFCTRFWRLVNHTLLYTLPCSHTPSTYIHRNRIRYKPLTV